jgi:hypothetical protein
MDECLVVVENFASSHATLFWSTVSEAIRSQGPIRVKGTLPDGHFGHVIHEGPRALFYNFKADWTRCVQQLHLARHWKGRVIQAVYNTSRIMVYFD